MNIREARLAMNVTARKLAAWARCSIFDVYCAELGLPMPLWLSLRITRAINERGTR